MEEIQPGCSCTGQKGTNLLFYLLSLTHKVYEQQNLDCPLERIYRGVDQNNELEELEVCANSHTQA